MILSITGAMIELDRRTGAIEVNGDEDKVCFERSKHIVILIIPSLNTDAQYRPSIHIRSIHTLPESFNKPLHDHPYPFHYILSCTTQSLLIPLITHTPLSCRCIDLNCTLGGAPPPSFYVTSHRTIRGFPIGDWIQRN